MPLLVTLLCLIVLNAWVTRRVWQTQALDKKGLHIAMVWIAPFVGAGMTWLHLLPYRRAEKVPRPAGAERAVPLVHEVAAPGVPPLVLGQVAMLVNDLPLFDWGAVQAWLNALDDPVARSHARLRVQRAWLDHLGAAMGGHLRLHESDQVLILSSLEDSVSQATVRYVARARKAIGRVLGRLAQFDPQQRSILLVLEDEEWYYRYVSAYYPDGGEFAFSGGMFIDAGCPHFVVTRADLSTIEPVIAHELTHSALSRLRLPLWLDEGLAVNTERKVAGSGQSLYTPQELWAKHLAFWGEAEIQQFWSGESFRRTDDGNLLSYDLARVIVEQLAKSWDAFEHFVLHASRADGGAAAAAEHLAVDLGAYVCALLDRPRNAAWSPPAAAAG